MKTPTAFEWHNYETGHCYVDYVPHVDGKSNILDEKNGYTKIPLYSQQPQKEQEEEVSHDNYKKALKMINKYYRQISGRSECIAFHIKYIQPIEEFIKQHQTTKQS